MNKIIQIALKGLISVTLIASCSVAADTKAIDEAVKKYYAGFPDEAISMLKPVALSGDADAQYLLGNILYSLSKTGKFGEIDDPVKWYKMAAAQKSVGASYALGVIFHDKWRKSRDKNEAATAIVYYQRAVESGYKKAQTSLNRIKSRSGISQPEAATLVKLQEATSVPESAPEVQAPDSEQVNLEIDETQAPAGILPTSDSVAIMSESIAGSKTDVDVSNQAAQIADIPDDEITTTVTLADIANQCQNYTETGFNLYAETIKDALFSGMASLVAIKPDASESAIYSAKLANNQFGIVVFLDLHDVPKEVALSFKKVDKYEINGSVVDSKVVGSNCAVSLVYHSVR